MPTTVPVELYRTIERANAAAKAAATATAPGAAFGVRRLTAAGLVEELWEQLGFAAETGKMACQQQWPDYDESKTVTATTQMAVQVSGKVKANIVVPTDASDEEIVQTALADPKVAKLAEGMTLVKSVVVKGRLVSLIFKPQA